MLGLWYHEFPLRVLLSTPFSGDMGFTEFRVRYLNLSTLGGHYTPVDYIFYVTNGRYQIPRYRRVNNWLFTSPSGCSSSAPGSVAFCFTSAPRLVASSYYPQSIHYGASSCTSLSFSIVGIFAAWRLDIVLML